jgi:ABC-type transport system involved in multi-copper enzyme maturation permease subunit
MYMAPQKPARLPRLIWLGLPGLLVIVVGAGAIQLVGSQLPAWLSRSLWATLAVAAVVLLRLVCGPVFGPVLFYDLLRATRRGRYALLRCIYGAALLVMLFLFYSRWCGSIWGVFDMDSIQRHEAARFAEEFFYVFVGVQLLLVLVLTPALTAGAIAEEKERRTLEFLFATELRNHEIVLGKLASRLAFLALLVLTGLPVLGLLQFLGGVDPNLVLAGFAATGVTMLSLAGLSIFNSAYARKPLTAIFLTYLEAGVYLAGSYAAFKMSLDPTGSGPRLANDVYIDTLCAGNIWVVCWKLLDPISAGMPWGTVPMAGQPQLLRAYCLFHGLVLVVSLVAATLPFRVWSKWQAAGRMRRAFVLGLRRRRLPRVGDAAMVWKEVHAEPLFRFNRAGLVVVGTFVALCLIFGGFYVVLMIAAGHLTDTLRQSMNTVARSLGTFIACLLLLGVAVRAAGSITGERERQTLDSLLGSPLAADEILWGKWLGSVLCGRKIWWYLAAVWLAAVLSSGLHPLAVPLLAAAWAVYAIFLASLGLWFSLVCRTTLRASIWTVVSALGMCLGPWLLVLVFQVVMAFVHPYTGGPGYASSGIFGPASPNPQPSGRVSWIVEAVPLLGPPSTLSFLAFYEHDFDPGQMLYVRDTASLELFPGSSLPPGTPLSALWVKLLIVVLSLMVYVCAALILWGMARVRFARLAGRISQGRPGQAAPPVGA